MTLGENICARRKALGMTQRQLGEACGKEGRSGEVTVQHWEHDRQEPSMKDLRPLCRALQCTLEELIPPEN